jgi:hypothetical protein
MRTYATSGMAHVAEAGTSHGLELHLFSPYEYAPHVEVLAAVAHFHVTRRPLGWGHTVDFGRPWLPNSGCTHGLVSLPYLDGPPLEWPADRFARFLWLVPITSAERELVRMRGVEALEERFEAANFDYLDPFRPCMA